MQPKTLNAVWLGRRPYSETYDLQVELLELRRRGTIADTLLLLEHEPTITLGRGAKTENLLATRERLDALGVVSLQTSRGGDVTLHAPGQLVAYPIVDLSPDQKDVRKYVQLLSLTMARLLLPYSIGAGSMPELIGVWVDAKQKELWPGHIACRSPVKLGAIGVRLSRWVTMHGFALNLSNDMSLFELIVPCGISEYGVSSLQSLTGQTVRPADLCEATHSVLAELLKRKLGEFRTHRGQLSAAALGLK